MCHKNQFEDTTSFYEPAPHEYSQVPVPAGFHLVEWAGVNHPPKMLIFPPPPQMFVELMTSSHLILDKTLPSWGRNAQKHAPFVFLLSWWPGIEANSMQTTQAGQGWYIWGRSIIY